MLEQFCIPQHWKAILVVSETFEGMSTVCNSLRSCHFFKCIPGHLAIFEVYIFWGDTYYIAVIVKIGMYTRLAANHSYNCLCGFSLHASFFFPLCFLFLFYFMYTLVLAACMSVCLVPLEVIRGHWVPWEKH